jgi:SsrA-binding protein
VKIIATNRKAQRDYDLLETWDAGIELKGTEVKSLRTRNCSIDEGFALVQKEQIFLYNMHIPDYAQSSYFRHDPKRTRKLLLHRKEIKRLIGLVTQRGLTIIPLKVYFTDKGFAKVQIAVAKGKRIYDKRKKIREEMTNREIQSQLKNFRRGL